MASMILSLILVCFVSMVKADPSPEQICTIDGEVDICPEGMSCQLDGSGHPYCHVPGAPVPSSHCLTEDEYEPFILHSHQDVKNFEQCDQFTHFCPEPYVCCRTHHGHRCYPKASATLLSDEYEGFEKK